MTLTNPFVGRAHGGWGADRQGIDAQEVRRSLAVLADPAHTVELRGLPSGRSYVVPGSDLDRLAEAAEQLSGDRGIYYALNPTSMLYGFDRAAKVADIVKRRWLLVDVDPEKPNKDLSATDGEKAAAQALANAVQVWLTDAAGWPEPVRVDSGNGWHLLYRVDLPNDKDSHALCRTVLHALKARFDTDAATVDGSVHNPSRIAKLPGTWARKGDDTADRPHRMARLLPVPPVLGVVSADQLRHAVALLATNASAETTPAAMGGDGTALVNPFIGHAHGGEDCGEQRYARQALALESGAVALAPQGERNNKLNRAAFSLGQFVTAGHLTRYEVVAALTLAGKRAGLADREIEATIESGLAAGGLQPRQIPQRTKTANGAPVVQPSKPPEIVRLDDLMRRDIPAPKWAVPGILSEGLSILAGKPKLGKSWVSLNLAITLAAGGMALQSTRVIAGDVLYLALEDRLRRIQDRSRKVLGGLGMAASARLHVAVEWPRMGAGGLEALSEWIVAAEAPRLVIVDVWQKFRPPSRTTGNQYEVDYEAGGAIKRLADEHGISVLILHHCKKAAADDVVDEISGTLGLAGSADGLLVLHRVRGENEATLNVTGRDVDDQKLALTFDPDHCTWKCEGPAEQRSQGKVKSAILDWFKRNAGASMFPGEVADALREQLGKSATASTVRTVLLRLVDAGALRKVGGKYAWPGIGTTTHDGEVEF